MQRSRRDAHCVLPNAYQLQITPLPRPAAGSVALLYRAGELVRCCRLRGLELRTYVWLQRWILPPPPRLPYVAVCVSPRVHAAYFLYLNHSILLLFTPYRYLPTAFTLHLPAYTAHV